ncbi:MAG: hypothetical protein WA777_02805 [Rhodanobacter sp.]
MDIFEIRHRNLLLLLEQLKARGTTKNTDAGQALGGIAASFLSQLKGGKKMGEEVARKVEAARYLPKDWMDHPQWEQSTAEVATPASVEEARRQAMQLLPPDARALLENYFAAGEAGKEVLKAAAQAIGKTRKAGKRA